MSLHAYAKDKRILAAAIYAPMTYMPAVAEFRDLAENPILKRSNAEALLPALADRPLFISIGSSDTRVGAEHCFSFYAKLRALCRINPPVLFTGPGASHAASPGCFVAEAGYYAGAAFLLQQCAEQLKMMNFD